MLFGSVHNASVVHSLRNPNAITLGVIFDTMGGMILLRQEGTFAGWNATGQTISCLGSPRNSTGRKSFALVPDDFGLAGALGRRALSQAVGGGSRRRFRPSPGPEGRRAIRSAWAQRKSPRSQRTMRT